MEQIVQTVVVTDSDDETYERLDNKLSLTDETYNLSKIIKLERISAEPTQGEYSDNEVYDDNFETTDLIEYEDFHEGKSDSTIPDEDDDIIIFVEDISSNHCGDGSKKCNFFIPVEQIKKEKIEPLASNDDSEKADNALEFSSKSSIIEGSSPSTTKSAINEICIENVLGGVENLKSLGIDSEDIKKESMENDDPESTICIIGSVFSVQDKCLDSPPEPAAIDESITLPQLIEDPSNSFVEEPKENGKNATTGETITSVLGKDLELLELTNKIDESSSVDKNADESLKVTTTLLVLESRDKCAKIPTTLVSALEENAVVLETPKDESPKVSATLEEEIPLTRESKEECAKIPTTLVSSVEENAVVLETPKDESPKVTATLEKDLPLTPESQEECAKIPTSFVEESSENVTPESATSDVNESPKVTTSLEEELPLALESQDECAKIHTTFVEESPENTTLESAISDIDEDALLLESSEDNDEYKTPEYAPNLAEEDLLLMDTPEKKVADEIPSIVEGDSLILKSSGKGGSHSCENVGGDSLLLEPRREDENSKNASTDSSLFESANDESEVDSSNITTNSIEELVLDSRKEESSNNASNLEVEGSLTESPKDTPNSCFKEDSLLLDSLMRVDKTPNNALNLEVEDPSTEASRENIEADTSTSCFEENSLLLDYPIRVDDSSNKALNLEEKDSLTKSLKENITADTPNSCLKEHSPLLDKTPNNALNLKVEDSLTETPKENIEADTPNSCLKEDSLLLDSLMRVDKTSNNALNLEVEDPLTEASKENIEADTPTSCCGEKSLLLNSPIKVDDSSNKALNLKEEYSLTVNENITDDTPNSCLKKNSPLLEKTPNNVSNLEIEDLLTEPPKENIDADTSNSSSKENSLLLDSSIRVDKTLNNNINLEVEDSFPESSKENIEATSCFKEDSLLLDSVRGGHETSTDAASIIEEDTTLVSEAKTPKTVAEDSLVLNSPEREDESSKNATRFEGEDNLHSNFSKEDFVCELPKTDTSCVDGNATLMESVKSVEENSLLSDSSKNDDKNMSLQVVEEASLESSEKNNKDESLEKDTLLLESSNSPKRDTEQGQSTEANSSDSLEESTSEEHTILENNDENEETLTNTEEIRNSIRMQLTNLRSKNRFDFLKDVQHTKSNIDKDEEVIKKPFVPAKILTVPTINKLEPEILRPKETEKVEPQEDDNVSNAISELRKIINKPKTSAQKETVVDKQMDVLPNEPVKTQPLRKPNNISLTTTDIRKIIGTLNTSLNTDIEETNSNDKLDTDNNSNPFVSDTLDEFLTDSKLNVSYDIPKSAAEEGIIKDYNVDPVMLVNPQTVKEEEEKKDSKMIAYKPKTLAEKRRILERNKLRTGKKLKNIEVKEELDTRSYVMFKNKKVFLHSKYQSKCLAYVESEVPEEKFRESEVNNQKPSLLKELYRKASPVKYRPGPLSRKHRLQSDYSQWTTELKPLPGVTLSLKPQFRKPLHPNLIGIAINQWGAEVSEDQVEFALSALKTEEPQDKIFKIDLNYENKQEKLLVRKKLPEEKAEFKITTVGAHTKDSVDHKDDDKIVAQVMENLINYVEIKEVASTLIKDDEEFDKEEQDLPQVKSQRPPKRRKKNITKTNRELLRLNCKVVTMVEEEDDQKNECSKSHCRLGCVCSSLKSNHLIGVGKHCQKAQCIFECNCPKYANQFLTTDTVTKIEDISKKYLAKEEKEFTQTVICTNDNTFVVGMSSKPRRVAKLPKKYSEFFDDDNFEEKSAIRKKVQLTPCSIAMDRVDFSGIVPYCWVHYLYNCHCKGTSISFESRKRKLSNNKAAEYSRRKIPKKSLQYNEEAQDLGIASRTVSIAGRFLQNRNRKSTTDRLIADDFEHNITQSDRLRAVTKGEIDPNRINDSDALKYSIIQEKKQCRQRKQQHTVREEQICDLTMKKTIKPTKKAPTTSQRKRQSAEAIASTDNLEYGEKIKIEEPKSSQEPSRTEETPTTNQKPKVAPVFEGEIICNDSAWLKKMCNNTQQPADSYARILPWAALLNGYLLKTINVYCIWDAPLRLVLTKSNLKIRAARYLDVQERGQDILKASLRGKNHPGLIRQSETVRDIVKWLITGNLHTKYTASTLSFLLVEVQPRRFEVRGCCTQKPSALPKPTPEPESNIEPIEENNETDSTPLDDSAQNEFTEIKHKNMYNQVMSLFITRNKFKSRELMEDGCDDDLSDNLYMWVELPEVCKVAKWRVIFLKNDFMYLYFKTVKYSIKYTDIVKLTEIARDFNSTLMVRNLEIRRCHNHPLYGIHFSPKYLDRFFVGPYYIDFDEEDIDTLIYRNQSLVSSSSLKSGNNVDKCGSWMYERGEPKVAIVDLTEDDVPSPSTSSTSTLEVVPQETVSDEINASAVFKVISSKPRQPSEFNRFIVTNIPHFGYLGAYQPDDSQTLEVSWPFENKILQFETADRARDFLQKRFKQVLQPIPVTFDIQVIVMLDLDRALNEPIKTEYLTGNCICGSFGTLNINEVSKEFCLKELKMPKEHIIKLFNEKVSKYTQAKIFQLAKLNCIKYKKGGGVDVILDKTKLEIQTQELILRQKESEIELLEKKTKTNLKNLYSLIKNLPIMEQNLETLVLKETLRIRPKGLAAIPTTTVIEIDDDDDVIVPSTSTNVVDLNLPGTSLLKPVSRPARASLPKLYPIKVFKNKSLLKVDAQKNVPPTVEASQGNSSPDIVWVD